jgi:hypothetical protein
MGTQDKEISMTVGTISSMTASMNAPQASASVDNEAVESVSDNEDAETQRANVSKSTGNTPVGTLADYQGTRIDVSA